MVLKRLIAATASIALMATPAMAAGTSAAASSTAAPATEKVDGMQAFGGSGNIAVILAFQPDRKIERIDPEIGI